jgi:hypothetical protein
MLHAWWLHDYNQGRLKNHNQRTAVTVFGGVSRRFVQKPPTKDTCMCTRWGLLSTLNINIGRQA